MTINEFMKKNKSQLADYDGFAGNETIQDVPAYHEEGICVWFFDSVDNYGFIREDLGRIHAITIPDVQALAEWNDHFDIRVLGKYLDSEHMEEVLKEARIQWFGFYKGRNLWGEGKQK